MDIFSPQQRVKAALALILVFIFFIVLAAVSYPLVEMFNDAEILRAFIDQFGVLAPLTFIGLQVVQVFILPIPGQVVGLVSGYLFGPWWGSLYSMVGVAVGSFLAVFLSRKMGRPFVEKVVQKDVLKRFDYLCERRGRYGLFLIFLLPALPDDVACLLAGLTSIKIRTVVLLAVVGRLPGFVVLNVVGNSIAISSLEFSLIIVGGVLLLSLLALAFGRKIEALVKEQFK